MTSSLTSNGRPSLPAPVVAASDPFVADAAAQRRHSDFVHEPDSESSPTQARRVLEAYLADTDRRLDEAGKLGTALVSQRKALAAQLHELEKLHKEGEINPELRNKLADIEREYNDVARESARVFLPKQRVPSNETNSGSPYVPEGGRGGRRSVSPSKFESHATGSPTKLSVPNRKGRNQPSNRVHDIEFAAEISTSLIAQVRNLQGVLSERDEELKSLQADKAKLEIESENLQQRFKTLDESEHRYKEENWNLETRLQELSSQQRDAADREKRLTQALALSKADQTAAQKELDEVKLSHSKLAEQHAAAVKHHDIDLGTAKRAMDLADGERAALQRKVDDLASKNEELARAYVQRGKAMERGLAEGMSDDDLDAAADSKTPEQSPPPSPIKGTPRHSMLETETVKSSLHHAQRTIQSQRSQLHREKTEKLELRRIIQDLRDDLEKVRSDASGLASGRRARKMESKELKKPPPRLLGSFRSSRQEILADETEWEDNLEGSPRPSSSKVAAASRGFYGAEVSDHFDTANEASESAFETANERATETEDFQTGNEDISGSDTETETEGPSRGFGRMRRPPSLPAGLVRQPSFHSTASTSADEDDRIETRTPTAAPLSAQRSRFRLGRGPLSRSSRQTSEEPSMRSSPLSHVSGGTPQAGQSLFAELRDLGGSDDEESAAGTPCRRSMRSATPASARQVVAPVPTVPQLPKAVMVDSGVMTDPVSVVDEGPMTSAVHTDSDGVDTESSVASRSDSGEHHEHDIADKLAQFPVPPSTAPVSRPPTPPVLGFSLIQSLDVEPRVELQTPPTPPTLRFTPLAMQFVEPREELQTPPTLCFTPLAMQFVEPLAEPTIAPPILSLSTLVAEELEPVEASPPRLTVTPLVTQAIDPIAITAAPLTLSDIVSELVEPVEEPELPAPVPVLAIPALPTLSRSCIMFQQVEPVSQPDDLVDPPPSLTLSTIRAEGLEPREEPAVVPALPELAFSDILAEHVQPAAEPQTPWPELSLSSIVAQDTDPIVDPPLAPPELTMASISSQYVEPVLPDPYPSAVFGFSTIEAIETRPISPRSPKRDGFILPIDEHLADEGTRAAMQPNDKLLGLSQGRGKWDTFAPMIAEDETRQSRRPSPTVDTPDSQRPFKEISSNSNVRPARKQDGMTSDQGAQTALTAGAIDKLLEARTQPSHIHAHHVPLGSVGTPDTTGTVRIHRSQESLESMVRGSAVDGSAFDATLRPGSATSGRGSVRQDLPPLPPNHRQMIDAARTSSARSTMGPPLWPASAMKHHRPRTPGERRPTSAASARAAAAAAAAATPRAVRANSTHGTAVVHSPTKLSARSRQSSVSSFASEIDSRFNTRPDEMSAEPPTIGGLNTDPRMIQAITQTMIGEFLWKYTRKTGRDEMSEKRHRRYFWVHPYTRTLYWSNQDPSTAGRTELRAKSVPIEAVRVVSDDNPMPPGLHRKSLIIISPGRTIKFTCTTGQRHETWFNALSYLLLRTTQDSHSDVEEVAGNMTREDVDEFNPKMDRRPTITTQAGVAPPSLSSYHSRTTRNDGAADGLSMEIPTLTPGKFRPSATRSSTGRLSKLSGYWKTGTPKLSGRTLSGLRTRGGPSQHEMYEASEVHDSAEDLRTMMEQQDRDSDRLENVRACCDGKHDVGTLPHTARRGFSQLSHSQSVLNASNGLVTSTPPRP
ncbi:hypothetical protein L249_8219 [Ophiocordyceps polyrhachis-furcata BCC 54312]|uniref:PH domain-containing protein n=1 Tax=Ophiocordyceps polyrhachis-furcata BCC 54312 TaxID=1330021 RepID=A0A367LGZ8_9HYPO|nr:hypothetical protein L249_8219 [Ophiocordyceps polyrhachis-furcata BCC 54312]